MQDYLLGTTRAEVDDDKLCSEEAIEIERIVAELLDIDEKLIRSCSASSTSAILTTECVTRQTSSVHHPSSSSTSTAQPSQ